MLPFTPNRSKKYLFTYKIITSTAEQCGELNKVKINIFYRSSRTPPKKLSSQGIKPTYMCLDSEASLDLQISLREKNTGFQIVPTGMNLHNIPEQDIRTFKDNLITGICDTHTDFPLKNKY